jgi:hypothetical protein
MTVPAKPRQKPSPLEVAASWGALFAAIRAVLIEHGSHPVEATKEAGSLAAQLTKETDYNLE